MSRYVRYFAIALGLFTLVLGLWAFLAPHSFYNQIAPWPPYNEHLFHDVGSFQAGIGATLIIAAFVSDALLVALSGAAVGSVIHAISHIIDSGTGGGRRTDPAALSILAALVVIAAVLRWRDVSRNKS
jgi:hypothetical protein